MKNGKTMTDPKEKYRQALAAFAAPGNRWGSIPPLTLWATAAGIDTEEVLADAHAVGVHDRDGDIRRGMSSATAKLTMVRQNHLPQKPRNRTKMYHSQCSERVRQLMDLGKDVETFDAIRELSPVRICPDRDQLALKVQCELQLLGYFTRSETAHVFRPDAPSAGEPGRNIMPLKDWLQTQPCGHPVDAGEIVRPNPLTGALGKTKNGKDSYIAQSCIAAYRHMVFEFDAMPLPDQCRFWAGVIRQDNLPLVSLVYSGNKSIHGVIRADAPDAETWDNYRQAILDLFATDADTRYRLDPQALHPLTGTRLAGVTRASTGKVQELLWIAPNWRDTEWQRELNNPQCVPRRPSTNAMS